MLTNHMASSAILRSTLLSPLRSPRPGISYSPLLLRDPYAGLVEKQPLRVLAGLRRRLDTGDTTIKGWTFFLQSAARESDKPRLAVVIARRLAEIQPDLFAKLVLPMSRWLDRGAKRLFEVTPDAARLLFDRLVEAIIISPDTVSFGVVSADGVTDWFEASWNSAVGHLAEVLFATILNCLASHLKQVCRKHGPSAPMCCDICQTTMVASPWRNLPVVSIGCTRVIRCGQIN